MMPDRLMHLPLWTTIQKMRELAKEVKGYPTQASKNQEVNLNES